MPDLRPIPTEYNGHLFRSRLEARWAVFFDALGVRYEYEAEGYDLFGDWYLPDFWLPDVGCFIEIKPDSQAGLAEGYAPLDDKALTLAARSHRYVLVVSGSPWPDAYGIALHADDMAFSFAMRFAVSSGSDAVLWLYGEWGGLCLNPSGGTRGFPVPDAPRLLDAYRAGRSARFEHGESGRTL